MDLLHRHYLIGPGRVQAGGVDGVDDGIPLHIRMEEPVHAELKKFPQNADGHGKAKRNHGQKEWRQIEGQLFIVVEQQHQRKAYRRRQKAVDGVEHGVPMGHVDIESIDLSQDLGRENEAEDRNFQGRRQLDPQPDLHPAWHI